jgi:hypothetical protein
MAEEAAAARGFPWISFYSGNELADLARSAGLGDARVCTAEVNDRYFASRADGLHFNEALIRASRQS